jgi:hypothetical protein
MPPRATQRAATAMAIHVNADYPPPKTWEQFEELCADVYAADWSDPALQRYGRAGQAQHGVDIVARHGNRWPVGLQCRKKSQWPVVNFSIRELDEAVKEALKFRPKLQSFYILTTAPVDAKLQAHARKITARHQRKGLFDVNVVGWSEIVRRATLHGNVAVTFPTDGSCCASANLKSWWRSSPLTTDAR